MPSMTDFAEGIITEPEGIAVEIMQHDKINYQKKSLTKNQ